MRGLTARNELHFISQTKAAIIIQSHTRKLLAYLHYTRTKKAAVTTQCAWRGRVARLELQKLKMAAKETGAQAAKNKLEKQVEELIWRLQLKKRMRADLEEAKTQENENLKSALQEMQSQFKETKVMFEKEREAVRRAKEKVSIIQEVPVVDNPLMEKLTNENEKLKALANSLEKKIDEIKKMYEEASRMSEERLKKALDAESKIIQLKTTMQSLTHEVQFEKYVLPDENLRMWYEKRYIVELKLKNRKVGGWS